MSAITRNQDISNEEAAILAKKYFGISGSIKKLPGELDFNFKVVGDSKSYILKISRAGFDQEEANFQEAILLHVENNTNISTSPKLIPSRNQEKSVIHIDSKGEKRCIRVLSWVEGRLWSEVNPLTDSLFSSLGAEAAKVTSALLDFNHPFANRKFDWDIANAKWTCDHILLFSQKKKELVGHFQNMFINVLVDYESLPKSIVHNDANDNNVIVTEDLLNPEVRGIIDYGDAVYTQTINDLAITIAYAIMNKCDPLSAASEVIKGYSQYYKVSEREIDLLYILVAMRLIITVTKAAINKEKEPDNVYLQVSAEPAWDLLAKWKSINIKLATLVFRSSAGLPRPPQHSRFTNWANEVKLSPKVMFPAHIWDHILAPDLSVGSNWLGHQEELNNINILTQKFKQLQAENSNALIAGGYGEARSIYSTDSYKTQGNNGPEYRTIHLGVDFWLPEGTHVNALLDGEIIGLANHDKPKNYGGTIILRHDVTDDLHFYSLYGHLSTASLKLHELGSKVKQGTLLGYLGNPEENGGWSPHLHFQLMLDLLGNEDDFPGVAIPAQQNLWQTICPDPNLLFKDSGLARSLNDSQDLLKYRNAHLGKSLSLSYEKPLTILRGAGAYLIDELGRRYLDTVNNVAHVGHEHPDVVAAGQRQMAVLNTNTRYLHPNINEFAEELLKTFPSELSVVHFVNSGSEANELALRMAKVATGNSDMIALEIGYHGNTQACLDVSSYKFDGKGGKGAPAKTHIVPLPDSYRGLYQGEDTAAQYASHVDEQIDKIDNLGCGLAGFIAESIISCGGQIELPKNYLELAYHSVRKAGGLCIADEVQVGCGRVGSHFWGFELHNVIPDIVTIGKPIGNGHPLGAVVCTQKVADAFANGMEYFNTFGGNPVSCAIGKEVLKVINNQKLQENALNVGNFIIQELKRLKGQFPIIGDVRGKGLFLGLELTNPDKAPLPEQTAYLVNRMKEHGILMSIDGPDKNVIKIKPPLVFSKENAVELTNRLEVILAEDYMKSVV